MVWLDHLWYKIPPSSQYIHLCIPQASCFENTFEYTGGEGTWEGCLKNLQVIRVKCLFWVGTIWLVPKPPADWDSIKCEAWEVLASTGRETLVLLSAVSHGWRWSNSKLWGRNAGSKWLKWVQNWDSKQNQSNAAPSVILAEEVGQGGFFQREKRLLPVNYMAFWYVYFTLILSRNNEKWWNSLHAFWQFPYTTKFSTETLSPGRACELLSWPSASIS